MTEKEKINMIEEILELENGTLNESSILTELEEWDSVAALSFIALMDEKFKKEVTGSEVNKIVTVKDALSIMN